jgi:hypothetical protein
MTFDLRLRGRPLMVMQPVRTRESAQEAINAGVYVSADGLEKPVGEHRGHRRAAKIAVACRCAQEVREIGADPELDAMLRQAGSRR